MLIFNNSEQSEDDQVGKCTVRSAATSWSQKANERGSRGCGRGKAEQRELGSVTGEGCIVQ